MICKYCKTKNRLEAEYCKGCGRKFSDTDRDKSHFHGPIGKINLIEEIYNKVFFKKILDSNLFKLVLLLIFVAINVYNFSFKGGNKIQLVNSKNYKIEYNEKVDDYYIILNKDESSQVLNVYIPNSIKSLESVKYSEDNSILENNKLKVGDPIVIEANTDENNYYVIKDSKDSTNSLKVLVYVGE